MSKHSLPLDKRPIFKGGTTKEEKLNLFEIFSINAALRLEKISRYDFNKIITLDVEQDTIRLS